VSVRRYGAPPAEAQKESLRTLAGALARGGVRIVPLSGADEVFGHGLMGRRIAGVTYGVGFVADGGTPDWCVGYVCEAFVLECAAMGLGTCWTVGTYKQKPAREQVGLRAGERLLAVTPIGVPAGEALRALADDDRPRKPILKLTGLSDNEFEALPEWQREAILCVRSGPSAINRQPWTVRPEPEGLFLQTGKNTLDAGIAMFHAELAASVNDLRGRWSEHPEGWRFQLTPDEEEAPPEAEQPPETDTPDEP
jgi:hypothetical protein